MLTLFPRIRHNPPAPPPPQPPATPDQMKDLSAPQRELSASMPVETATAQAVATTAGAVSAATQAAPEDSASASGPQFLMAEQDRISINVAAQAPDSIDSQLMSVFTEAFVASTSGAAAQKSGAEPFVVEITCIATSLVATGEPAVIAHQEIALAEHASSTPTAEPAFPATVSVESASTESAAAPAEASEAVGVSPVAEPTADVLPAPDVAQSQPPQAAAPAGAEATAPLMLASEVQPAHLTIAATTIFDELDILHEVAESNAAVVAEPKPCAPEPTVALDAVIQATAEGNREQPNAEIFAQKPVEPFSRHDVNPQEALAVASQPAEVAAEQSVVLIPIEQAESQGEPALLEVPLTASAPAGLSLETLEASGEAASEAAAAIAEAASEKSSPAPSEVLETLPDAHEPEVPQAAEKPATPRAIALPRKPSRSKASFFELQRIPEPEVMQDSEEVEAYSSAAAQAHLNAIDDTFVAHAQLLVNGRERGRGLDIGAGPGQIAIKLGARLTRWKFIGIDRSAAMIEKAREGLSDAPEVAGRIEFQIADGNSLDFPDGTFDLVICNSVLHHMAEPQNLFSEIARVVKPGGAILLRDLMRPPRFSYGSHIRKHGKHYQGEMKRLYVASLQAAYTEEELRKMIAASALRDVRIFRHNRTHIGFERPLAKSALQK